MKKIVFAGLLILVASMMFSGIPISAHAESDSILLNLALKAKREIQHQISSDSPAEVKRLFEQASRHVVLLEESLERGDDKAAKQHFLSAMEMFKRISQMISSDRHTERLSTDTATTQKDYSSDLQRMKKFLATLKSIARSESVNFDQADGLVILLTNQIRENDRGENDREIVATLAKLKTVLDGIHKELRKYASETNSDRTIEFFNNMLDRLEDKGADQKLLKDARNMLDEYEQLIDDRNYDDAKILKDKLTQKIREIYNSTP